MSQTRSEVLSLLKQFDQEFSVFEGAEESFLVALLQEAPLVQDERDVDWKRLTKAPFALPMCYVRSRNRSLSAMPEWFAKEAKRLYLHQISANESRIRQIQQLAGLFQSAGLKVLFVKGAAELAYSPDDTDFHGRRYMCDIDLLCSMEDIAAVDVLLRSHSYTLWDHNLKHWDGEQIRQFSLERYSHYIYNAYDKNYMELHGRVAVGANCSSYPPEFENLLIEQSVQVDVRGMKVWVPKAEHMLVYSLCHAASKSNNEELIYLDQFYLDEFSGTDCAVSPPMLINKRLDICQLRYLFQLRDLLQRFDGCLNFAEIKALLAQLVDRDLNAMYAAVASHVFGERFPLSPIVSAEYIKMCRQRYVYRFMLPLLAERIESIVTSRLEQLTADYIEKQVERISVTVERRVLHTVTERVLESAKHFISRRTKPFRMLRFGTRPETLNDR